jgi:uncharacterized protein (TIGR03000 family)
MLRFLTVSALSLTTVLVSLNSSTAQQGPGQLGPLWQRTAPGSGTYYYNQGTVAPAAPEVQMQAPATESQSFYNGPTDSRAALLRVRVPADAKVWIDGTAMTQSGEFRSYISPALEAGQNYTYQLRVQTSAGEQSRNVTFRSGDRVNVDFRAQNNQ